MAGEKVYKNQTDIFNFLRFIALFCVLGSHARIVISSHLSNFDMQSSFPFYWFTPAWFAMGLFFLLSGYLLGKGFYSGKYKTDREGILNFWYQRLVRILPVYLFFLLLNFLFTDPDFFAVNKWKAIIPLLTFTYNGAPLSEFITPCWFISTIMQLYLLAPLGYKFVISKIKSKHLLYIFLIAALWCVFRLTGNYVLHLTWATKIYAPSWFNIDLFFCGMLFNGITNTVVSENVKKYMRPLSLILLFGLIFGCTYEYYKEIYTFQRYFAPTLCIFVFGMIVYSFDSKNRSYSEKITLKNVVKNPLRIFDIFGILSFEMYLYHSYLFSIMPDYIAKNLVAVSSSDYRGTLIYCIIFGFIVLTVWSAVVYEIIEKPANNFRKNKNIIVNS